MTGQYISLYTYSVKVLMCSCVGWSRHSNRTILKHNLLTLLSPYKVNQTLKLIELNSAKWQKEIW